MKHASSLIIGSLLTLSWGIANAQVQAPEDDSLIRALAQVEALENTASNNTDLVLAEPLLQLAEEYRRRGQFADAHSAIDRGMQIVRINSGLYAPEQIPYLEKKIENFADWGDWESAREMLEHILWLHRTKTRYIDDALLDNLMDLTEFHLRGISEDFTENQTYHFRRATAANWLAVAAAERIWGRTDPRLTPMLYSLVKQYHLQAVAVRRGGSTGYGLREIVPGSNWVRERADMLRYYYETGMRLLLQLEDIYSSPEHGDAEALAMTRLYTADWQLMFSRTDDALESYATAFTDLTATGVEPELANRYFAEASLLPETEFHTRLADALAARVTDPALANLNGATSLDSAMYFAEWSVNFPYARSPYSRQRGQSLDSNFALFSFNLSGVTEITRWISRRRVQAVGEMLDVTLVQSDFTSLDQEQDMLERLEYLDFRPRLVDGAPQETTATLVYQPAQQYIIPRQ